MLSIFFSFLQYCVYWIVSSIFLFFFAILQSALLDLLGTTDVGVTVPAATITNKNALPSPTVVAHNNDLLDLLGSLDLNTSTSAVTPTLPLQPQASSAAPMFSPTNTSNFLVDGLLSTSSVQNGLSWNSKRNLWVCLHYNHYNHDSYCRIT